MGVLGRAEPCMKRCGVPGAGAELTVGTLGHLLDRAREEEGQRFLTTWEY